MTAMWGCFDDKGKLWAAFAERSEALIYAYQRYGVVELEADGDDGTELQVCPKCGGDHKPVCRICNGYTIVGNGECRCCNGTGYEANDCPRCGGAGEITAGVCPHCGVPCGACLEES